MDDKKFELAHAALINLKNFEDSVGKVRTGDLFTQSILEGLLEHPFLFLAKAQLSEACGDKTVEQLVDEKVKAKLIEVESRLKKLRAGDGCRAENESSDTQR